MKHPSEFLFSNDHPFSKEFDVAFVASENQVLEVSILTPASFAEWHGAKTAHSAFSSLFLDTVMGCSVLGEMSTFQPIATLNLMVNHHRKPLIGERLICISTYHNQQGDVANVSAELKSEANRELIATGIGTLMIGTRSRPVEKTNDGLSTGNSKRPLKTR